MPKNTRVGGHFLWYEGAPHDDNGNRIHPGPTYPGKGGRGRAKCSCGQMSEVLATGAARQRWHAAHKQVVAMGRNVKGVQS